jgi:hypothetical protein
LVCRDASSYSPTTPLFTRRFWRKEKTGRSKVCQQATQLRFAEQLLLSSNIFFTDRVFKKEISYQPH